MYDGILSARYLNNIRKITHNMLVRLVCCALIAQPRSQIMLPSWGWTWHVHGIVERRIGRSSFCIRKKDRVPMSRTDSCELLDSNEIISR